ncbi:MAG: hypothetical protein AVO35_02510 [Candidatus Aegiribacteria sp. MLS_C]|nr:MAG: hypothetical protein AVO35_02510 [Candidatus Aegiribacteria sp. MLS_C]
MKRVFLLLMIAASVAVLGLSSVFMIREFSKVINLSGMGDMWSFLALSEVSPYAEFTEVDERDFPAPPIPAEGDLLVEVDGLPSTQSNYFSVFNVHTPAGEEIDIKFLHDGEVRMTSVVTRSIPLTIQLQVWILVILRTLIIAGLIIVGLWGLVKRPWSASVRALTLFCYSLALGMNISSPAIADAYAEFQLPLSFFTVLNALQFFYPAFWLKLQMLFPSRKGWYDRHALFINILIFAPAIIFGGSMFLWHRNLNLEIAILWTVQLILGFLLLTWNYRKAETFVERRQTRLVLLGSAPGVVLILAFNWLLLITGIRYYTISFITRMVITNVIFFFMLLIPVSLAYAFGRYKLLSVEARLKRGTRFLAVSLLLLLVFIGILYLFGNLVLRHLDVESRTPTLILGLMLAFVFMPAQRKLHGKLERRFYPERVRLRELLQNFLASNIVRTESSSFWKELEKKLAEGLAAESIYPVLRMTGREGFAVEMEEPAPFDIGDQIVRSLETTAYPILFDELMASGRIVLSKEQEEWFLRRHSAILLPLSTNSGLVGFLVISSKTNGEDFTPEELEMLSSFSAQTALVAENFELLNERLVKQRLEEQLRVARDIQKGLLPGEIPCRPGLEVEALIRFCLEVAGDYYDVIPLDGNRTVLSIGDVAGKGVGSAMLMANLQASLRTTQAMGVTLSEACRQINRIVYENTPTEMFISLFMVMIDVDRREMVYVNAGHNPPMLVNRDGETRLLTRGGVLLGVSEDTEYEEAVLSLSDEDLILMYTDGVCEAMDDSEEEFGESRLVGIVVENRRKPLAELLQLIQKEVESHHGSDRYEDDFTLLAARLSCREAGGVLEKET